VQKIKAFGSEALAVKADLLDPNCAETIVKAALDGFKSDGIDIFGHFPIFTLCP
jgi:hypothetical protein